MSEIFFCSYFQSTRNFDEKTNAYRRVALHARPRVRRQLRQPVPLAERAQAPHATERYCAEAEQGAEQGEKKETAVQKQRYHEMKMHGKGKIIRR